MLDRGLQQSDWSRELTEDQITYKFHLSSISGCFNRILLDSASDAQAGLEIFTKLNPLVQATTRDAIFRDSYTFAMRDGRIVFIDPINCNGTMQYVRWRKVSKEFDEAHGHEHISYIQYRANKAAKRRAKK